jgi:hypothetical protein
MHIRSLLVQALAVSLVSSTFAACDQAEETDELDELDIASDEIVASHGRYLIANGYTGKANFYIEAEFGSQSAPVAEILECELTIGALAVTAKCPGLANPPVTLLADDEPSVRAIRVGFTPIRHALTNQGYSILSLASRSEPIPMAEAVWENGHWECKASEADVEDCKQTCVANGGGGTVTVDEEIPSNYLDREPTCMVTCKCADGSKTVHPDPPQVIAF